MVSLHQSKALIKQMESEKEKLDEQKDQLLKQQGRLRLRAEVRMMY